MPNIKVNPPKALRKPMSIGGTTQEFKYFEGIETILFQLKNRSGGEESKLTSWQGAYDPTYLYQPYDMALQNGWLAIAINETNDPIEPLPKGAETYVYQGTSPTDSVITKQLVYGTRYNFPDNYFINGYRLYTITGNKYSTYAVNDPLGEAALGELISFTATTNGWVDLSIVPRFLAAGTYFDLIVIVAEPDPTPTETVLSYAYTTPNNPTTPLAGQISHSDKSAGTISIHKTGQGGQDNSVFLATLTSGDTFQGPSLLWSIQKITDMGTYYDVIIAPAQQDTPDGVFGFTFFTTVATPITHLSDPNYYLGNPNVSGLFTSAGGIGDLIANDNAYGADLLLQGVDVSDDWERIAYTQSVGGSSGSGGGNNRQTPALRINSLSPVTTTARYGINAPVYAINETINLTGEYDVSIGFEVSCDAANRSVMCGLYLDNVLIDNIYEKEPKDTRDLIWVYKEFTHTFDGFTDLKFQVGKGNGGGNSAVTAQNIRFKAIKP